MSFVFGVFIQFLCLILCTENIYDVCFVRICAQICNTLSPEKIMTYLLVGNMSASCAFFAFLSLSFVFGVHFLSSCPHPTLQRLCIYHPPYQHDQHDHPPPPFLVYPDHHWQDIHPTPRFRVPIARPFEYAILASPFNPETDYFVVNTSSRRRREGYRPTSTHKTQALSGVQ